MFIYILNIRTPTDRGLAKNLWTFTDSYRIRMISNNIYNPPLRLGGLLFLTDLFTNLGFGRKLII